MLVVEVGDSDERLQRAFPQRAVPVARIRARRRRRLLVDEATSSGGTVASFPGRARHVGQYLRASVHGHDLRREPRAGARRHRRRLPARTADSSEEDLQRDVERRRSGTSKYTSQRREPDRVRILSGVFEGRTTGTPIGLLVENTDQRSYDYEKIKDRFRPGHADYTYQQKYGLRDYRGGGRSSARETVMRVAAGAIARKYLRAQGIEIFGYLAQMGSLDARAATTALRSTPTRSSAPNRRACRSSRR